MRRRIASGAAALAVVAAALSVAPSGQAALPQHHDGDKGGHAEPDEHDDAGSDDADPMDEMGEMDMGSGVTGLDGLRAGKKARLAVVTTQAEVGADRVLGVELACSASTRCVGTRHLVVHGERLPAQAYRVAARSERTVRFTLSDAQYAALTTAGTLDAEVRIKERRPKVRPALVATVGLRLPDQPAVPGQSFAYTDRNWTPTSFDTCPASLHRSYSVVGPDGKLYPTWHPPTVVDPGTGERCSFGHEHGDDPATSDLYDLVSDYFASDELADRAGLPFGYVSEQLVAYAGEHAEYAVRHEDNVGHKVIVRNDVRLVADGGGGYVYTTDDAGQRVPVTCDVLMKVHQGSHSADATANNAHELFYAIDCNDGTRMVTATMSRLGDPNEFNRSCEPSVTVDTSGSQLPDGDGGQRLIPDRTCIERHVLVDPGNPSAHSDVWGVYEVWQTANELKADDGSVIASFDPWFGVRNPSRYFMGLGQPVGSTVGAAWETDSTDGGVTDAEPWLSVMGLTPFGATDPRSPFNGSQRDFYLGQSQVRNSGGPEVWYTDPYGEHGGPTPFVGSVRQLVSSTDNAAWPTLARRLFDRSTDYGAGNSVHAPN